MAETYTTIQGDVWDAIALKVYGAERHADFLMQNNFKFLDTLVFSAGVVLSTPPLPEELSEELPPWRSSDDEPEEDPYDVE